jgi:hypothetical protein
MSGLMMPHGADQHAVADRHQRGLVLGDPDHLDQALLTTLTGQRIAGCATTSRKRWIATMSSSLDA